MEQQQATTPTDVAPPSIDDKIAAKFGLTDQPTEAVETPQATDEATPESVETGEVEVAPEEETQPEPEAFEEINHRGQLKRVSKEEMRMLAQKGFDYEANMVENKAERQRLQGIATALQAQQALGAQIIDHIADAKAAQKQLQAYASVDWIKWANDDPIAAFQAKQVYDQHAEQYNRAMSAANQVQAQLSQTEQHVTQEQLAFEQQELLKRVPEWRDETRKKAEVQGITADLSKTFTADELQRWGSLFSDHRVVGLLRDGYLHRQAKEAAKAKRGQLQGLPQAAKPGVRQNAPTRAQSVVEAKTDLRKARSPETRKAAEDRMIAAKFGIKL